MKNVKFFWITTALLLFASSANAAISEGTVMSFNLKGVRQDLVEEEVRPDVYQSTIRELRVTNKEVLRAMQINGVLPAFPNGTRLIADGNSLNAVAPDGTVLTTTTFTTAWGTEFEASTETSLRIQGQILAHATTVSIAVGSKLSFSLLGLLTQNFRLNLTTYMSQVDQVIFSNLVGTGLIDSVPFLFTGTISGKRPPVLLLE